MNLPDCLVDHPDGEIRVVGSRISLYHMMSLHREGRTAEQIADEFDSVPLETIRRILAFSEANRAEVDGYLTQYRAALDRLEAETPRRGPSLDAMKRRLERRRAEAS